MGDFLLIWANWYDCADGQLARMTGKKSLLGRILDGFAGDVWFSQFISLSVYGLRHLGVYGFGCCQPLPDLFVIVNSVLWPTIIVMSICFSKGADKCELDSSEVQYRKMKALKWSKDWFEKIYLFFMLVIHIVRRKCHLHASIYYLH